MSTVRYIAYTFLIIMAAGQIGLGAWQLQRMNWKQELIAEAKAAAAARPVSSLDIDTEIATRSYANMLRTRLTGYYRHDLERYIYQRKTRQRGYQVITPFIGEKGFINMIDRGWVSEADRDPANRHEARKPQGKITITGITRTHEGELSQLLTASYGRNNVWYWYDAIGLSNSLPAELGQDAEGSTPTTFLLFVQLEPGGEPGTGNSPLVIPVAQTLPNNHLQYAIIWFLLALGFTFLALKSLRHKSYKTN